jgi:peptidoglycan hydrolase CwlO-like protein
LSPIDIDLKEFIKDRFDGITLILTKMDSKLDDLEKQMNDQNKRITTLESEMKQAKKDLDILFKEDREIRAQAGQLSQKVTKALAWAGGAGAVMAVIYKALVSK